MILLEKTRRLVPFAKMNGIGNEIIVIDLRNQDDSSIGSDVVQAIAKSNLLEFDQIMAIYNPRIFGTDYFIEIWNKDGSKAKSCGNGIRCVTHWLYDQDKEHKHFVFDTEGGVVRAQYLEEKRLISVDMGKPRLEWWEIPLDQEVFDTNHVSLRCGVLEDASVVSMGNPHAIFFVAEDIAQCSLRKYGPIFENAALFPEQANISVARVLSPSVLKLHTWERGVGLTRACGTASCASVIAACRRGLTKKSVKVIMPGGDLLISWRNDGHVYMTGVAEYEFSGFLNPKSGDVEKN